MKSIENPLQDRKAALERGEWVYEYPPPPPPSNPKFVEAMKRLKASRADGRIDAKLRTA